MKKTIFKTTQYPIQTLIDDIDHGKIALPDIQRPFVWDSTKVRDLFDSIYKGFPIGYLLFWENVESTNTKNIGTDTKESKARSLIIDGQQRLTALFTSIKGIPVITEDYKKKQIKLGFNPIKEIFEVTNVTTEKNPEFISDISILFKTDFSEFRFISEFIQNLKSLRDLPREDEDSISKNITRLRSIVGYEFTILEIAEDVSEETVANIFVRVNSQGVVLKQSDFVLTLLSVFWEEGRRKIEAFAKETRDPNTKDQDSSAYNYVMDADPGEILRSIVGYGFGRGRMKDVYSLLRGRDFESRDFKTDLKEQRINELKVIVEKALDNTTWHGFISIIQSLGYKHKDLITSRTNFFYSYSFYLIGKNKFKIQFRELENIISKWFVFGAITSRYSGSSESVFEGDLASIRDVKDGSEFISKLNDIINSELTNDYWSVTVPSILESSSGRNPLWLIFVAAQVKNNVKLLFSEKKLADVYDPIITTRKNRVEKHHIFPKNYLNKISIVNQTDQNQVANYMYLDYRTNIDISDEDPRVYFDRLSTLTKINIDESYYNHALPKEFYKMEYRDFLKERRGLIARYLREYFGGI